MSIGHPSGNIALVVKYLSREFSEDSTALHNPVSPTFIFQGELGLSGYLIILSSSITNDSEVHDNILLSEKSKLQNVPIYLYIHMYMLYKHIYYTVNICILIIFVFTVSQ